MADTFSDMINESTTEMLNEFSFSGAAQAVGNFAKTMGTNVVNNAVNKFDHWKAETLGDLKAKGKLDLQDMTATLRSQWDYFRGQQQVQPSLSSVADFLDTHLGLKLSEESLYKAVYGFNPQQKQPRPQPVGNEPNEANIAKGFRAVMSPKVTDRNLATIANAIAGWAKADKADAGLVSQYMNYIGATNPELLKRPEMSVLGNFAHGGLLNPQMLQRLLTGIAKLVLKAATVDARGGGAAAPAAAGGAQNGQGGTMTPPPVAQANGTPNFNPQPVASSRTGVSPPSPSAASPIPSKIVLMTSIQKCGITPGAWNDIQRDTLARDANGLNVIVSGLQHGGVGGLRNGLSVGQMNAASARVMQMLVGEKADPKRIIMAITAGQASGWPLANIQSAIDYLQQGGNVDGVVADMNKSITTPKLAATALVNLIGAEGQLSSSKAAPAQAPAKTAAPAPAPAAPAQQAPAAAPAAPQGQARP